MKSSNELPAQAFLRRTQNGDGGWGYGAGHASTVEATAAAALALARGGDAASIGRAAAWLAAAQHRDGGWGSAADDAESGWQTAWAVLALAADSAADVAAGRGAAWLLNVQLVRVAKPEDVRWAKATLGIDPALRGWPWLPGQAGWVEPTALALLALAPQAAASQAGPRLAEGVRYLQDRRCRGGGWNVGNPVMFSQALPPRAVPTAWVLLALARLASRMPNTILAEDVTTLRREMVADGSASALAWGLLALRALDQDDPTAAGRLLGRQDASGGWDANPYHTAIALLALTGGLP
jgi:hypothetical protein